MKIFVIGSGGREHAIIRALVKYSDEKHIIYASHKNLGIVKYAQCYDINLQNHKEVIDFCNINNIELVVIGPEQPIADGLSNSLRNAGFNVFAPSKYAALLESSKSFAKNFMQKYDIPTAKYATFGTSDFIQAKEYINNMDTPIVIKADGLAAGKGVVIATLKDEAIATVKEFLDGAFGAASQNIVIEEFMQGEEASIFAICDGNDFVTLTPAQDHKRVGDGDTGKNTGGMGAISPVPIVTDAVLQKVSKQIIKPVLAGMKTEGHNYIGCLYVGLMIENGNPRVVEFNCRFGDPETQAVLSIFKGNFAKLIFSAAIGKLDKSAYFADESGLSACCVILASDGYPDKYDTNCEITGEFNVDADVIVYHSGTKMNNEKIYTNGGRVLGVTGVASNLNVAIIRAYQQVDKINFENKYFRRDIGSKYKTINN